MKKVYFIVSLLVLSIVSCEKDYTGILDSSINEYQILSVSPSGNISFNAIDSLITINVTFTTSSKLSEVSCDIFSSENKKLNDSRLKLFDDGNLNISGDDIKGDNKFANKFPLSSSYPIGDYKIYFYVTNLSGEIKQAAQSNFIYDNGQDNIPPIISNLVMVDSATSNPIDSVNVDVTFIFSVQAEDPNGYSDVSIVYFELFRPDGSIVTDGSGNSKFRMSDDGNFLVYGDKTAFDGIFSFKNKFLDSPTTQRGNWTFDFQAQDRGGLLSNKLTKILKVL